MFSEKLTKYYSHVFSLSTFHFNKLNSLKKHFFYFNLLFFYSTFCLFFITFLTVFRSYFGIRSFFMRIFHNKIVFISVHLYDSKKNS